MRADPKTMLPLLKLLRDDPDEVVQRSAANRTVPREIGPSPTLAMRRPRSLMRC